MLTTKIQNPIIRFFQSKLVQDIGFDCGRYYSSTNEMLNGQKKTAAWLFFSLSHINGGAQWSVSFDEKASNGAQWSAWMKNHHRSHFLSSDAGPKKFFPETSRQDMEINFSFWRVTSWLRPIFWKSPMAKYWWKVFRFFYFSLKTYVTRLD